MLRAALYVGCDGAGLAPCARVARLLQVRTVAVVDAKEPNAACQAAALARLLSRLADNEFDLILVWRGADPQALLILPAADSIAPPDSSSAL